MCLTCRIRQLEKQRMLDQPTLVTRDDADAAKGQAFFPNKALPS
jgi:hypothetical protein